MGYYTNYSIDAHPINRATKKIVSYHEAIEFSQAVKERILENLVDDIGYNPFEDDCKWYCWKDDMAKATRGIMDVVFVIEGEGEEAGDLWKAFIYDGEIELIQSEIIFRKSMYEV